MHKHRVRVCENAQTRSAHSETYAVNHSHLPPGISSLADCQRLTVESSDTLPRQTSWNIDNAECVYSILYESSGLVYDERVSHQPRFKNGRRSMELRKTVARTDTVPTNPLA